jgi:hypothetical protein
MRITIEIESDASDEPVSVSRTGPQPAAAGGPWSTAGAFNAGAAPIGLGASAGLVQEPPAFTAPPPGAPGGDSGMPAADLSAGPAPGEEEPGL